jgi:hypothetical protein
MERSAIRERRPRIPLPLHAGYDLSNRIIGDELDAGSWHASHARSRMWDKPPLSGPCGRRYNAAYKSKKNNKARE